MAIAKERIDGLIVTIQNLYLADDIPWMIGYSGGKDSTAAVQLVWMAMEKLPVEERNKPIHIMNTDTLVESPVVSKWVEKSLEHMRIEADKKKLPFVPERLIPDYNNTFWVNLIGRGYPYPRMKYRWCTDRLKIQPVNDFIKNKIAEHGEVILVLGTRKQESSRRNRTMTNLEKKRVRELLSPNPTLANELVFSPMEDWTDDDVWAFLMQYKNPWGYSNMDLIHTDYSQVQIDILSETKMWKAYDYIASISEAVTKEFLKKFPTLKNRIILIKNILPEQLIKRQAESFSVEKEMNASGIKILSIGRFCYAKNFDNVPDICRQIRQNGLEVTWYLIGFGKNEKQIRKRICETGMKQYVKILGKKENPYPYIRACDVYVQPSRYEGNCVAVREAQMLGKPVIITGYPTAESQLRNGIDGIIVPLENRACGEKISEILREPKRLEKLVQECRKKDYSNRQEINKIECICRG